MKLGQHFAPRAACVFLPQPIVIAAGLASFSARPTGIEWQALDRELGRISGEPNRG